MSKTTVVLVHGAFADASGFDAVIDRLRDDGYPVRAAPNPLVDLRGAVPDALPAERLGPRPGPEPRGCGRPRARGIGRARTARSGAGL